MSTDLAEVTARFALALRAAGVPVTAEQAARLAAAMSLAPPGRRSELYWLARVTLVADAGQLDAFDRIFAQVFAGLVDPAEWRGQQPPPSTPARRPRPAAGPPAGSSSPGSGEPPPAVPGGGDGGGEGVRPVLLAAASPAERLRHQDFAALGEDELHALRAHPARLAFATPPRPSRRRTPAGRGDELDVRATLRAARRTGGLPLRPVRRRRRT
ncbi:MAG TPA: hypothetical protein VFN60_09625, partial [Acidimicrobiales bacterium]|nr:hypothetical protein [Acidimicrobiales bacterium]